MLYVPDSKFNLVLVDSFIRGTHFEVLFGNTDYLLTDYNKPISSQVLDYSHGGLYHLAGKCVVRDQGQTTNSTREPFSVLAAAATTTTLYKQAGQHTSGVDLKLWPLSPNLIYVETTLPLTPIVYLDTLVSCHLI